MKDSIKIFNKKIGERVSKLRKDRGLSQEDLAIMCNKQKQNISRLETGSINPSLFYLYELSMVLNVKISDFFKDDNNDKNDS